MLRLPGWWPRVCEQKEFFLEGRRVLGVRLGCSLETCSICESSQTPRAPQAVSPAASAAPPWAGLPTGSPPLLSGVRPCAFL